MFSKSLTIAKFDPELAAAIAAENQRQQDHIELIASENYVSCAVMEAQGSQLTNKYAEGYPAKRYYGGCEHVDVAEQLAIDRVKQLFGAAYANVQPHSGSQANQAVYTSVLQPGDTILGMSLAHGGHLTHGASVNISGKLYQAVAYGLDENEVLDYAEVERLALEHKPKMIVAGASAYALEIDWARFREIADKVGAYLFVDMAHYAGLIAAGEYPNPVPFADFVTTTTHKTLRGPRGGVILCRDTTHEKALNSAIFPSLQGGPLMHVIAAKAVCFKEALQPEFKTYAKQVKANAQAMAEELVKRGLRIVSGRTESHVFLVDLRPKNITGKGAEEKRHPQRPGKTVCNQRHPRGRGRHHHARIQRGRRARTGQSGGRRARQPQRRSQPRPRRPSRAGTVCEKPGLRRVNGFNAAKGRLKTCFSDGLKPCPR